jgi:putative membrane protein
MGAISPCRSEGGVKHNIKWLAAVSGISAAVVSLLFANARLTGHWHNRPMTSRVAHDRFAFMALAAFSVLWLALAIAPLHRPEWLLENVIVFVGVPVLVLLHRHLPLSKISISLIFVFLCLHEVGAHYTYAEVPYDRWFEYLTGKGLNEWFDWERNHFDRAIHFLYGLLITYPVREIVLRMSSAKGFWTYLMPVLIVISTSTIFELLEWLAAIIFGGDLGSAYLGMQGDIWDAQKDMALAVAGTLVATMILAGVNSVLDRDFAREWEESLRIKHAEPLGEVEIARLLAENKDAENTD